MYYYQRLRDMREDNDLTQKDIADLLQMKYQQYARYESGEREIPLHHLITLAKHYDVSLDYLAGLISDQRKIDGSPYTFGKNNVIISGGTGHKIDMH